MSILTKKDQLTNTSWQSFEEFNDMLNKANKLTSDEIKLAIQKALKSEETQVLDFTSNFKENYFGLYQIYLKRWYYKNFEAKPTKETNITSLMLDFDKINGYRDEQGNYLFDNVTVSKLANLVNHFGFEGLVKVMNKHKIVSIHTAYDNKIAMGYPEDKKRKKASLDAQKVRETKQAKLEALAEKGLTFENGNFIDLSKFIKKDKEGNLEMASLPNYIEECIKLFVKDSDCNLEKALNYLKSPSNKNTQIRLVG